MGEITVHGEDGAQAINLRWVFWEAGEGEEEIHLHGRIFCSEMKRQRISLLPTKDFMTRLRSCSQCSGHPGDELKLTACPQSPTAQARCPQRRPSTRLSRARARVVFVRSFSPVLGREILKSLIS